MSSRGISSSIWYTHLFSRAQAPIVSRVHLYWTTLFGLLARTCVSPKWRWLLVHSWRLNMDAAGLMAATTPLFAGQPQLPGSTSDHVLQQLGGLSGGQLDCGAGAPVVTSDGVFLPAKVSTHSRGACTACRISASRVMSFACNALAFDAGCGTQRHRSHVCSNNWQSVVRGHSLGRRDCGGNIILLKHWTLCRAYSI